MSRQITQKVVPRLVRTVKPNVASQHPNNSKLMEHLVKEHKLLSLPSDVSPKNVANVGGERSYVLLGSLAKLERALMKWSMNELVTKHKFIPVVVPNIVHDDIIERCGFPTRSTRSQVYKIAGNDRHSMLDGKTISEKVPVSCLAGTSEFALASIHIGDSVPAEELPKRYCALSRCYRAETSRSSSEWGLYRVHYFNKVEMVALTMPSESMEMHEEFLRIQTCLFDQLNLHYQVLDMPEDDLGLSAKKKYDVEAWLSGRQKYGEISSTSNCEDYQSSRLNIKYSQMVERGNQLQVEDGFVHTINGTACSSIRTMIALIEQNQTKDGNVLIPKPLIPYMNGVSTIPTDDDRRLLKEVELYPKTERD